MSTPRSRTSRQGDDASSTASTARTPRSRYNKIYRTPPTPPPEILAEKEKTFTLDGVAAGSISRDYSRANPKLGPVIPPYNSQRDGHPRNYFGYLNVDRTLKRTGQDEGGTSINGPVMDRFHETGPGAHYLALRNQFGAGHSAEQVTGHSRFMQDVKPIVGYHGLYGYRRNTPWLRASPSPFGTGRSPTH